MDTVCHFFVCKFPIDSLSAQYHSQHTILNLYNFSSSLYFFTTILKKHRIADGFTFRVPRSASPFSAISCTCYRRRHTL